MARLNWKCEESPTGAHHWIHMQKRIWECKFCHSTTSAFAMDWKPSVSGYKTKQVKEYLKAAGYNAKQISILVQDMAAEGLL